jgi:hypothetical protein
MLQRTRRYVTQKEDDSHRQLGVDLKEGGHQAGTRVGRASAKAALLVLLLLLSNTPKQARHLSAFAAIHNSRGEHLRCPDRPDVSRGE